MPRTSSLLRRLLPVLLALAFHTRAPAQLPAPVTTGEPIYKSDGKTDQPFTVEVTGARRAVNNILVVRLTLTNRGDAPLAPRQDFSGNTNPADDNRISAVYGVDPNGRKKLAVLRDAQRQALCSRIDAPIQPGERRALFVELPAPPDTTSAFELFFPKADPILNIPIGLPQAGEPLPGGAEIVTPATVRAPASPVPVAPAASIDQPTSNNEPDVYTNQTGVVASNSPGKGVGSIQSANSAVPFTVEVSGLSSPANGRATLRLALINNGSGPLDASGQFNNGVGDTANPQSISGLYLVDPVSKQRFDVARENGLTPQCTRVDPPLGAGERRTLQAQFAAIPATVKSVYLYFPHAAPVADVPVGR